MNKEWNPFHFHRELLDTTREHANKEENWKKWAEELAKRLEDSDNGAEYHSFHTEDMLTIFKEFKETQK
jgi:hypothetical protein